MPVLMEKGFDIHNGRGSTMNTSVSQQSMSSINTRFKWRLVFSGMCIVGLLLGGYLALLRSFWDDPRNQREGVMADIQLKLNGVLALSELICWTMAGVGAIGWIMTRQPSLSSYADETANATCKIMAPSDVEQLVRLLAKSVLEIPEANFSDSIERQLLVSPANFLQFLDDLHIDYSLPVSSADRKRIDSIDDLIRLISLRIDTVYKQQASD